MKRRAALVLAGALALAAAAPPARALDAARTLDEYHHDAWSPREGAPGSVNAIAQTDDGLLWLATPGGLVRYDGVRFEPVRTLGGVDIGPWPVLWLAATPGNGLWLGFADHGAGRLEHGRYTAFGPDAGWTTVRTGAVDGDGVAWLESAGRLWRIAADRRSLVGPAWNLPSSPPWAIAVDPAGALHVTVASEAGSYVLAPHARRFERLPDFAVSDLAFAPDGAAWGGDTKGVTVLEPGGQVRHVATRGFGRMLFDRDGALWAMGPDHLHHIGDPAAWLAQGGRAQPDDFPALPGDQGQAVVNAIFEDHEGDVWLGTSAGLERYRENRLVPVRLPRPVFDLAIAADRDAGVWAASWVGGPIHVQGRALQAFDQVGGTIKALYEARDGTLWGSELAGLWRLSRTGTVTRLAVPEEVKGAVVRSLAEDADGALWVAGGTGGAVGRWRDGRWDTPAGSAGFPARWDATALYADDAGVVWAGTTDGEVLRIEHGRARRFGPADGLATGPAHAFFARGGRLWVAGGAAVAWFDGTRFHALAMPGGEALRGVLGLVETARGELWLQTLSAVLRIDAPALARALQGGRLQAEPDRFDALDGLEGSPTSFGPRPSMVEAADGKLWFATPAGLAWIDPAQAPRARPPVPLEVRTVTIDGATRDAVDGLRVPALAHHLEFAYSAAALAVPERVRFRYRLAGVDGEWQEAGTRRTAFYNDLPPGDYRLEVSSTNEDGAWQPSAAALRFSVAPAWFQAGWFRAGVLVAAVLALVLATRLRVRQLTAREAARMRIRQLERERIARELHDTLLQGTQGLVWRFQALAQDLPPGHPVRDGIARALDLAETALSDSRDRILGLREPGSTLSLADELERIGAELAAGGTTRFSSSRHGAPGDVPEERRRDIRLIVSEALHNAFRHAGAGQVELELETSPAGLRIVVRDDGRGIDGDVLRAGRPGHFGLAVMRERAAGIGAALHLERRDEGGTRIELRVPAAPAPRPGRRWLTWSRGPRARRADD